MLKNTLLLSLIVTGFNISFSEEMQVNKKSKPNIVLKLSIVYGSNPPQIHYELINKGQEAFTCLNVIKLDKQLVIHTDSGVKLSKITNKDMLIPNIKIKAGETKIWIMSLEDEFNNLDIINHISKIKKYLYIYWQLDIYQVGKYKSNTILLYLPKEFKEFLIEKYKKTKKTDTTKPKIVKQGKSSNLIVGTKVSDKTRKAYILRFLKAGLKKNADDYLSTDMNLDKVKKLISFDPKVGTEDRVACCPDGIHVEVLKMPKITAVFTAVVEYSDMSKETHTLISIHERVIDPKNPRNSRVLKKQNLLKK